MLIFLLFNYRYYEILCQLARQKEIQSKLGTRYHTRGLAPYAGGMLTLGGAHIQDA
jgi:hypothetical protein